MPAQDWKFAIFKGEIPHAEILIKMNYPPNKKYITEQI